MFKSDNIELEVTVDEIFKHITELEIFEYYVTNFEEPNRPFLSDLYTDTKPDCRIFVDSMNHYVYKDFGEPDHYFRCFDYLLYKYKGYSFRDCLRMVASDFNITGLIANDKRKSDVIISYDDKINVKPVSKSVIYITPRNWNLYDYKYWDQFDITIKDLTDEVIPCQNVYLNKGDRTIAFNHSNTNPMYAYKEYDWLTNEFIGYKIYRPLNPEKKHRFMCCSDVSRSVNGWNKLPEEGDLLIITKSKKDVICLTKAGFNAISLQAESNHLFKELTTEITKRFKNIIILYDNDEQGIKSAAKITLEHNFTSIMIPLKYDCKDMSELICMHGMRQAKTIIKQLIDEIFTEKSG